jgi:hypothetical protein
VKKDLHFVLRRATVLFVPQIKQKTPMVVYNIRFKPETIAELKRLAEASGRSTHFIVRELVGLWIKEQRKKSAPRRQS